MKLATCIAVIVVACATHSACALPAAGALTERPVTLVLAAAAGGGIDRTARLLAQRLAVQWHRNVIVDNRPGGSGRIAADVVAKAPPDGDTLLMTPGGVTIDLANDPLQRPNILRDLVPVSRIAVCQILFVVNPALPVRDARELVARARAAPGTLNYASSGVLSTMRLVGELFKQRTGTDIVQIPFKGEVQELTAVINGNVDLAIVTLPSALSFVNAGQVRALAIASRERSPLMPAVPTLAEAGIDGVEADVWYALLAPAGTPDATVEAIARDVAAVSAIAAYRQTLAAMGAVPAPTSPDALGAMLRAEVGRYREIIVAARIHNE
jgi:tripartite-type tricarboxylate transporter receptor subunit TctC